jgi:hypothetical protein
MSRVVTSVLVKRWLELAESICFGHSSGRTISTFVFIVDFSVRIGSFWHVGQAPREIARPKIRNRCHLSRRGK